MPKVLIYPEGATTNNDYMLQFKKGAFIGEAAIKPVSSKYHGPKIGGSGDVLSMFAHFVLLTVNPYVTLHLKEYPTFLPNDYFW